MEVWEPGLTYLRQKNEFDYFKVILQERKYFKSFFSDPNLTKAYLTTLGFKDIHLA